MPSQLHTESSTLTRDTLYTIEGCESCFKAIDIDALELVKHDQQGESSPALGHHNLESVLHLQRLNQAVATAKQLE